MKSIMLFFFLIFSAQAMADISLKDLGLKDTPDLTQTNPQIQKELEVRHSKLKKHEILGLTTWGLMTATMFTGGSAMDSNLHATLGVATGLSYMATAYYSLSAPKPKSIKDKSRMVWHKRLAWVHFPLMILVPTLGFIYKKNEENNKKHSALEKQHSAFAGALYGTYTLSAALMVIEF